MIETLLYLIFIALAPAVVALTATKLFSRQAGKILQPLLRFDLTAVMLLFVGCSCLLTIAREIHSTSGTEIPLLIMGTLLIVPGMLIARIGLDARREEHLAREVRYRQLPTPRFDGPRDPWRDD